MFVRNQTRYCHVCFFRIPARTSAVGDHCLLVPMKTAASYAIAAVRTIAQIKRVRMASPLFMVSHRLLTAIGQSVMTFWAPSG